LYNAYFPYSTGGTINHSSTAFKSVSDTVCSRTVTYIICGKKCYEIIKTRKQNNMKNKDES
jgi:hypothetical protein